jgi:LysR family transcriptional regulator of gallate degradation
VREFLTASDHLACVSSLQAEYEVALGQIVRIDFPLSGTSRPIGISTRKGWQPAATQQGLINLLRTVI